MTKHFFARLCFEIFTFFFAVFAYLLDQSKYSMAATRFEHVVLFRNMQVSLIVDKRK